MIRGFLAGALALIALQVFTQDAASTKVAAGGNVLVEGMKRLMSGDVAGVPQRKKAAGSTPPLTGGIAQPNPATRPSMAA